MVARFIAERYGSGTTTYVAVLGGGDRSRAFSFSRDGRELVLRLGCYQEDFLKDQKAMVFARTDLPIPTVLDVGEALGGTIVVNTARPEQDQCGMLVCG